MRKLNGKTNFNSLKNINNKNTAHYSSAMQEALSWNHSNMTPIDPPLLVVCGFGMAVKIQRGCRVWMLDNSRSFSVKSAYFHLLELQNVGPVDSRIGQAFRALWRCSIPSKVSVFVWKLLWQRISSRDALVGRGFLSPTQGTCCVFCFRFDKTTRHLFSECDFSFILFGHSFWLGWGFFPGEPRYLPRATVEINPSRY